MSTKKALLALDFINGTVRRYAILRRYASRPTVYFDGEWSITDQPSVADLEVIRGVQVAPPPLDLPPAPRFA